MNRRFRAPLYTLLSALVIESVTYGVSRWCCHEPLSIPISLKPGVFHSENFHTPLETKYRIEVAVDKSMDIDFEKLNCLLGLERAVLTTETELPCKNVSSIINMEWKILNHNNVVFRGQSHDFKGASWAKTTISREIGEFMAKPWSLYSLELDVQVDGSQLIPAHPRLIVKVNPDTLMNLLFWNSLITLLSIVIGGIGLVWLIARMFLFLYKKGET